MGFIKNSRTSFPECWIYFLNNGLKRNVGKNLDLRKTYKNRVLAKNEDFLMPISMQPDGAKLLYFNRIHRLKVYVQKHWVAKI